MTTDGISTARQTDVAYQNDYSSSLIRLKTQRIRDVSGNAFAHGSTEPSAGSQIHPGSSSQEQNKKALVWQLSSEYGTAVEALDALKPRKLAKLTDRISGIRNVSPQRPIEERFHLLQKFQGQVTEVFDQEFKARLYDLSGDDSTCEVAMFSVDEIDSSDTKLLKEGAIFYWYIGYSSGVRGRRRQSFISFSRFGRMTPEQFANSYEELGEMWSILSAGLPTKGQ